MCCDGGCAAQQAAAVQVQLQHLSDQDGATSPRPSASDNSDKQQCSVTPAASRTDAAGLGITVINSFVSR